VFLWQLYRVILTAAVFRLAIDQFDEIDDITIDKTTASAMQLIATGISVVGYTMMVCFARSTHRYQLYTTRESGKEYTTRFFRERLITQSIVDFDE